MAKKSPPVRRKYRGRRRKVNIPLAVTTGVLALLLAAAIVFVYVLDGTILRTEDGLRFDVPGWGSGQFEEELPPVIFD